MKTKEIATYDVIQEQDLCDLINVVQHWINHGWQPLGGVSITALPHGQAEAYGFDSDRGEVLVWVQAVGHASPHQPQPENEPARQWQAQ